MTTPRISHRLRARHPRAPGWNAAAALASTALALALASCGGDAGGTAQPQEPPPVAVQILRTDPTPLPRELTAVGTLRNPESTQIASETAGRVVAADIPQGQRVEAGHVLVRIEDRQARADLKGARARLENARQRKARLEALRESSVSTEQAYEDALTTYVTATADVERAEKELADTVIRAPFAGTLGLLQVTPGQYLEPGAPVAEITPGSGIELDFSIPQTQLRGVRTGQTVFAELDDPCTPPFEGELVAIEPKVDLATRTVRLKALLDAGGDALLPGMAVRVRLRVGTLPDAILIPQEALIRSAGEYSVYVLDEGDRAEARAVTLGRFTTADVHIRSGVTAGERVVVAGHQKLRPGAAAVPAPYERVDNPTLELGRGSADCGG